MMPVPDDVLTAMANAMLDPSGRIRPAPSSTATKVRKEVLLRALAAAEGKGWHLTPEVQP
jgi:hypothetical protein